LGYLKNVLKLLKWLLLSLLAFFIFVIFVDFYYPINLNKRYDLSREVLDSSNRWLYVTTNYTDKWRFEPNIEKIDPLYIKMLLNFEDKRFYKHSGVDILALFRAMFLLVKNRHISSGGSTITMQVARLLEPKKRNLSSKIVELIRALELEWHYSKKDILKTYLTLAPYGGNIEGVNGASWHFFSKLPYSLSTSEAALLVALPKNPESYRPDRHKNRAMQARNRVLKKAYKAKIITEYIYNEATKSVLSTNVYKYPRYAPHLSQKLLKNSFKKVINTTIDTILQKQFENWAKLRGDSLPKGASMAILVVENATAKVRVYIGSNDMFSKKFPGFIDMADATRSPGSALKPFIYTMGFEKHIIHPQTIILDKEVNFGNYHPHNT